MSTVIALGYQAMSMLDLIIIKWQDLTGEHPESRQVCDEVDVTTKSKLKIKADISVWARKVPREAKVGWMMEPNCL